MRIGSRGMCVVFFMMFIGGVDEARGQERAWTDLAVTAGRVDFDLSGTGHAPGFAVRTARSLSRNVRLELRALYAKHCGDPASDACGLGQPGRFSLFMPEAQLQYQWNVGRVAPYVGGGLGLARTKSPMRAEWDPTLSAAVGTAVYLTDRLGITGEFRLRGHETRFTGTTSEVTGGLVWRLPSF